MGQIYPILLAGGTGTRLWPLSRKAYPKQFCKIFDDETLFQTSAKRLTSSKYLEFFPPTIMTNSDYRFVVAEQLMCIGIDPGEIIIESEPKNTAASILAATIRIFAENKDAVLLVAPSDHIIPDVFDFHRTVACGLTELSEAKFVTFGIKPTYPETGYGYLKIADTEVTQGKLLPVERFIEKPPFASAKNMLEAGNFLWNSGMFLFKAQDMIDAFIEYEADSFVRVSDSVSAAYSDLGFLRLGEDSWSKLKNISIDHAIMEKAENIHAYSFETQWSDLGSWDAVWSISEKDKENNMVSMGSHAIDCNRVLLKSESTHQTIVGIGLNDIVAVAMPDAVLVAHQSMAQRVGEAVKLLREYGSSQADVFPKDHRPWGWFESLAIGDCFQVKQIYVKPRGALSLQSHYHRSEHWVVVQGEATITIDSLVKSLNEGESIFVPKGAKHRLENLGTKPLVLIEVQIGSYLGEDDIIRYEDIYDRD